MSKCWLRFFLSKNANPRLRESDLTYDKAFCALSNTVMTVASDSHRILYYPTKFAGTRNLIINRIRIHDKNSIAQNNILVNA